MTDITDPVMWMPLALTLALLAQGALLFLGSIWGGRINFVRWLIGFAWIAVVIAHIPSAVVWLTSSDLWAGAYQLGDSTYIGRIPTPFVPAVLLFFGGMLYREVTWIAMTLFARWVEPLISYVLSISYDWLDAWANSRGVSALALVLSWPCAVVVMVLSTFAIQTVAPSMRLTWLEAVIAFVGAPIASYLIQRRINRPQFLSESTCK